MDQTLKNLDLFVIQTLKTKLKSKYDLFTLTRYTRKRQVSTGLIIKIKDKQKLMGTFQTEPCITNAKDIYQKYW